MLKSVFANAKRARSSRTQAGNLPPFEARSRFPALLLALLLLLLARCPPSSVISYPVLSHHHASTLSKKSSALNGFWSSTSGRPLLPNVELSAIHLVFVDHQ